MCYITNQSKLVSHKFLRIYIYNCSIVLSRLDIDCIYCACGFWVAFTSFLNSVIASFVDFDNFWIASSHGLGYEKLWLNYLKAGWEGWGAWAAVSFYWKPCNHKKLRWSLLLNYRCWSKDYRQIAFLSY